MKRGTSPPHAQATNGSAAYGDTVAVGRFLGAKSKSTARRYCAELQADGLPAYIIGGRKRFKFSDVDGVMSGRRGADQ